MRIFLVLMALTTVLFFACGKGKYETAPHLEVKSLSPEVVPPNQSLRVVLEYFDKQGDLSEGILTIIRVRTNTIPIPPPPIGNDQEDTLYRILPKFPNTPRGEIEYNVDYAIMNEVPDDLHPAKNDSMYFRFVVTDKEGHVSDTAQTKVIVALNN